MNKIEAIKLVTRTIVGVGTSGITGAIIHNNVQPENLFQKVTVGAGGVVLGMMASDASKEYTDAKIDEIVALWNQTTQS